MLVKKKLLQQFGLENRNEITFVVSKQDFKRWIVRLLLKMDLDTTGGSIQLEVGR